MRYFDFDGHHYGIHITHTDTGKPKLELVEDDTIVYNITTVLSYSQYASVNSCNIFIDLDKYPFADRMMQELNCRLTGYRFSGYNKKKPRCVIEYDISKLYRQHNADVGRDKMLECMVNLTDWFSISTCLVNYLVHKKNADEEAFYVVTLDGHRYRIDEEHFNAIVEKSNAPVYTQLKKAEMLKKGATYVNWN